MNVSQVGAAGRFIEKANFLLTVIPLSEAHDVHSQAKPLPYIPVNDREDIIAITINAGQVRERLPDKVAQTDLDELFAPFLDQLSPYIKAYCD